MQIYPLDPTAGTTSNQTSAAAVPTGKKMLGQEDFLKLLSVQMQSQDPLNPTKDTDFIAQMASFSSLDQMKSLTASFDTFVGQQRSAEAQNYLGKTVTVADPDRGPITGVVSSITLGNGAPLLVLGGQTYDLSLITAIHSNAAPATSTTQSN